MSIRVETFDGHILWKVEQECFSRETHFLDNLKQNYEDSFRDPLAPSNEDQSKNELSRSTLHNERFPDMAVDHTLNEKSSCDTFSIEEKKASAFSTHKSQRYSSVKSKCVKSESNEDLGGEAEIKLTPKTNDLFRHACSLCDKSYVQKAHLKHHMNTKHSPNGVVTFPCTICDKSFHQRGSLARHLSVKHPLSRVEPSQFSCEICHKLYKYSHHLNVHIKNHHSPNKKTCTLIKKFPCTKCIKTFNKQSLLKLHMEEKHPLQGLLPVRYVCAECDRVYQVRQSLLHHLRKNHSPDIYTCYHCDKGVKGRNSFKKHIKSNHFVGRGNYVRRIEEEIVCLRCDRPYSGQESLRAHICVKKTYVSKKYVKLNMDSKPTSTSP